MAVNVGQFLIDEEETESDRDMVLPINAENNMDKICEQ